MKTLYNWRGLITLGGMVLILVACQQVTLFSTATRVSTPGPAELSAEAAPELEGDPIRGGRLYDRWWVVLGVAPPGTDHPLWKTQSTNIRSGSTTWRCKECHGWDYKGQDGAYSSGSHFTGFIGILSAQDKSTSEILEALKGATNPDHDFSSVMNELALIDLALFIRQELTDTDAIVGSDKQVKGGNAVDGQVTFENVCQACHGAQGTAVNFSTNDIVPEYLAALAQENPWEFIHKARVGQPGEVMPSGEVLGLTTGDYANLLAYVQALPTESLVVQGGRLYDRWWKAIGADGPTEDLPLWATQDTNTRTGADTWRCKECHGWDYKGKDGVYASGSHYTGFTGVLAGIDKTQAELMAILSSETDGHDFSGVLDEYALTALATFLREGVKDTQAFINADRTVNGDAERGKTMFNGVCMRCHGEDGKAINSHDADDPEYIGTLANDDPWEFFHKTSFGQPGELMPAGVNLGWSPQDIADILAFAQTLPTE